MTMLEILPRVPDWVLRAECTPADAELLDTILGTTPTHHELETRKAVARRTCAVCPVRQECAAAGDSLREEGVWGGSLRYVTGPDHPTPATYVAVPLVSQAVPSPFEVAASVHGEPVVEQASEAELLEAI